MGRPYKVNLSALDVMCSGLIGRTGGVILSGSALAKLPLTLQRRMCGRLCSLFQNPVFKSVMYLGISRISRYPETQIFKGGYGGVLICTFEQRHCDLSNRKTKRGIWANNPLNIYRVSLTSFKSWQADEDPLQSTLRMSKKH